MSWPVAFAPTNAALRFIPPDLNVASTVQSTAPVVVTDATTPNVTALVAAVLLLIVGFVVEQICKLPSDKSKDE